MKTPAAILTQLQSPLEIDEVEIPPLDFGQVLVELEVTRICGSQLGEIDGVKGPDNWLPHLLGHEGGGTVLEIGPCVKTVKPGDKVVLHWRTGSGIQASPPKYKWNGETVNAGWVTTFNKHAIISENRLTTVPVGTNMEIAALLADTLTTGFGLVNNDAHLKIGESIIVIGCGGIGLGVVLGAHLAGAHPIIVADLHDHKLEIARKFGATHTINSKAVDLPEAVMEILGQKPDVVVDGTGNPKVIETAYELTSDRGRTVLFGVMHHEHRVQIHTLPLHFDKILTGSVGGDSLPADDIPRYIRMMQDGRFDPSSFVSHRMPLEEINKGIQKMRDGEVIHAMVHFG
jgi:S-(hydroxymethyl)glutathione dehydrogenase / alcohol dehydrogenase